MVRTRLFTSGQSDQFSMIQRITPSRVGADPRTHIAGGNQLLNPGQPSSTVPRTVPLDREETSDFLAPGMRTGR
jgi:hypothetical protein